MAYIQNPHTGYKLDATEGVESVLTSADFIGNHSAPEIQIDKKLVEVDAVGSIGSIGYVPGSQKGTLAGFSVNCGNGREFTILQMVTPTGTSALDIGGTNFVTTGTNATRISTKTISINQYTGTHLIKLLSAKPSSIKIGGKIDEIIKLTADFAGIVSTTSAAGLTFKQTNQTANLGFLFNGSTLTVDGVALKCSECEVDIGLEYVDVSDNSLANGYGMGEIVDIKNVKITLNPLNTAASTFDFYGKYTAGTQVAFSWAYGTGGGTGATISATAVIESLKGSLDNQLQRKQIVLSSVLNTSGYQLRVNQT